MDVHLVHLFKMIHKTNKKILCINFLKEKFMFKLEKEFVGTCVYIPKFYIYLKNFGIYTLSKSFLKNCFFRTLDYQKSAKCSSTF